MIGGRVTEMKYHSEPFDKRIKENIKNYALMNLYDRETVLGYMGNLAHSLCVDLLLTDRHGKPEFVTEGFKDFSPDVVQNPGRKIQVQNRTIGHLYYKAISQERNPVLLEQMIDGSVKLLANLGEETYLRREGSIYMEEIEQELADKKRQSHPNERMDALTGVFNKTYFESRIKVVDRSEVLPVAVVLVNINDWKYANEHYGEEESDRLIALIADILKEEAKPEYIIGRVDGDEFVILIPLAQDGEGEAYAGRIQDRCYTYEDPMLAPSVAVGVVYKTNIEECIEDKMSDAEYEMFDNKFEIKNATGYQERLHKA